MAKAYAVVYRTGGTMACEWRRMFERFATKAEAAEQARLIERMGYKTLVHEWNAIVQSGLPIGWEYDAVNWEQDQITREIDCDGIEHRTRWRHHDLLGT